MVQVSLKQWSALSLTERKLARTLGITPRERSSSEKVKPILKPKPYLMRAEIHCYLCGSKTTKFFHMILKGDESFLPFLQSEGITEQSAQQLSSTIPLRSQDVNVSSCPACTDALGKWTKAELIKKLIQVFPVARTIGIAGGRPWKGK